VFEKMVSKNTVQKLDANLKITLNPTVFPPLPPFSLSLSLSPSPHGSSTYTTKIDGAGM